MITVIALLMGMVFGHGILLLLVPVFLPALEMAGVDLIWFGILVVLVIELGLTAPPIGINVLWSAPWSKPCRCPLFFGSPASL